MGDDEVDPTSDHVEDVADEDAPDCATCGDPVVGHESRVVTWIEDGQATHRHFCDDSCRADWDDERNGL